jgi:signal transduction histidine kinase
VKTRGQELTGLRVLWLENQPAHVETATAVLQRSGFNVQADIVAEREAFQEKLATGAFDIVISAFALPGWNALHALELLRKTESHTPFILLTGTLPEETALVCVDQGITDYVLKDNLPRLPISVRLALANRNAQKRLTRSREQLRSLAARLQSIREEERSKIAREVHDVLGQALTGIKMDATWILTRLSENETKLVARAKSMLALIDSTVQMVRRIATDLRPGLLDNLGLVAAIEWQAGEFQARNGITCRVNTNLRDATIASDAATAVFRIFQETLTNVARHAQATVVSVDLGEQEGRIILQVADNGRGIDLAEITQSKSIGLLGMRERAAILGGELAISGAPGQGTTVVLSLPMNPADSESRKAVELGSPAKKSPGLQSVLAACS